MPEPFWTLPNVLSLYRVAAAPVIAGCLLVGNRRWFVSLLVVSLLTDIADGWIARRFRLGTKIGARLDSFGDLLTFALALGGMLRFQWSALSQQPRAGAFFVFLGFYLLLMLTGLLKFGRQPSLHTYGFKIAAYLQGACFISTFLFGLSDLFYYSVLGWSVLACVEEICILLLLDAPRSDVKGLYWVLNERRAEP
jgi:CDP-diacylglycerol--glycerol-3-phosphate 3-phosphatidyltransferase